MTIHRASTTPFRYFDTAAAARAHCPGVAVTPIRVTCDKGAALRILNPR